MSGRKGLPCWSAAAVVALGGEDVLEGLGTLDGAEEAGSAMLGVDLRKLKMLSLRYHPDEFPDLIRNLDALCDELNRIRSFWWKWKVWRRSFDRDLQGLPDDQRKIV